MTDDAEPTSPATPDPQPVEEGLDVEAEQERLDDLGRKITEVRTQAEKNMPVRDSEGDRGTDADFATERDDDSGRPTGVDDGDDHIDRSDEDPDQSADDDERPVVAPHAADTDVDVDAEPDIEPDVDR